MPSTIMEYLARRRRRRRRGRDGLPVGARAARRRRAARVDAGVPLRAGQRRRLRDAGGAHQAARRHRHADARSASTCTRYYERGGALNIQTKRGCYFECVFCSYPLIEGSKVRMRTPAAVVDEIAGDARGARRAALVLRRQHLQHADPPRQGDLRGDRRARPRHRVVGLPESEVHRRRAVRADGALGLPGDRVRHRLRLADDDRQPARRSSTSTTCAAPRRCATRTGSSSATA